MALALVGAIVIRRFLGAKVTEAGPALDGLSVAVLMIFAIPLMDGVVARAVGEPMKLGGFIAGAFAGMLLCNLVMAVGMLPILDRRIALTAGYCSGGRHNALLMAVLPVTADPDIFLFIAAVQFPIYLIPTPSAAALSPLAAFLTAKLGIEAIQKVEHVVHRQAKRGLEGLLVGRQVGAFEHHRVDLGMPCHQHTTGGDRLALDLLAIERKAVAQERVGEGNCPPAGRRRGIARCTHRLEMRRRQVLRQTP